MSEHRRKEIIYVDEDTYEKIERLGADFKSHTHFLSHLLKLYERMLTR